MFVTFHRICGALSALFPPLPRSLFRGVLARTRRVGRHADGPTGELSVRGAKIAVSRRSGHGRQRWSPWASPGGSMDGRQPSRWGEEVSFPDDLTITLTGVTRSQLMHWRKTELLVPEVQAPGMPARGHTRSLNGCASTSIT